MITKENFRDVIEILGFTKTEDKFYKTYGSGENTYEMSVDFKSQKLEYAEGITAGRDTTKDFHQSENFVVFECVCRLLERGYEPKNIVLEATSGVAGRGQTQTYLDILVKDNNGNNYLIIECKTAGKEFDDAWAKVKRNGGQLFNYWTLFGTKHLCLYASDYSSETNKLTYSSNIIIFEKEDQIQNQEEKQKKLSHIEALLKTNPLTKGYKDLDENANQTDYFDVWTDTYGQPELYHGIFEEGCKPYEISEKITLSYDDLKEMEDYEEIQKKYHQFATIMRQHNVGSHENSFDKLVNLFLAKIVDETDNQKELRFNWKGAAFDDYYNFQDRLQQMYSKGMSEFLGEKVEYVSDEQIDNAFKFFAKDTPELSRDEVKKLFHIQKFFTNNDFSFLDVHNEQLFMQNVTILIKVVQMLQGMKLKSKTENQFLGDLFEGFLDQGVKQSEGQFFTPTPIVKFLVSSLPISKIIAQNTDAPKVIDYACGAGHFLNEIARVVKAEADDQNKAYETKDIYENIVGIEKEYRLSKVAKVSAFMYSQNEIQIVYGDGLVPHKNVKNGSFNILVANPPYSVKGFLETLDNNQKSAFSLYTSKIKTINEATTNSIETFFVERSAQLLASGGVAAIILPSSILSNGNIYTDCRKIILQNFNIIAIAEFGSGTFGKTGTNTVTLFLEKKPYGKLASEQNVSDEAIQYRNRVNAWFNGDFSKSEFFEDGHFLEDYCKVIETDFKEYQSWILGGDLPKSEIFLEYDKEAKEALKKLYNKKLNSKYTQQEKDKDIRQKTFSFISKTEKEKLYYYILSRSNRTRVIVAKSPTDKKEIKTYLGYEWSGAKGSEGIKYLGQNVADEDDTITKNSGIFGIKTPLFNPTDKDDETKICFAIRRNFEYESEVDRICNDIVLTTGASIAVHNLFDMIDFSRTSFDMQIKTNVHKELIDLSANWIVPYNKYRLSNSDDFDLMIGNRVVETEVNPQYTIPVISANVNEIFGMINKEILQDYSVPSVLWGIDGDWMVRYMPDNIPFYPTDHCGVLRVKNKDIDPYFLSILLEQYGLIYGFSRQLRASIDRVSSIIVSIPSKEVQAYIVEKCKKLDDEVKKARQKLADLKEKIEEIISNVRGERKKLSEICSEINPEKTVLKDYPDDMMISFVEMASVSNDGFIETTVDKPIKDVRTGSYTYFAENDIIIAKITPCMENGKCALATNLTNGIGMGSSEFHVFRVNESCKPEFLFSFLNRKVIRIEAEKNMTGASGHRRVPISFYEDLVISLPSLTEQTQIITQIKSIQSQRAELQKTIDSVPALKKAILDKELLAE